MSLTMWAAALGILIAAATIGRGIYMFFKWLASTIDMRKIIDDKVTEKMNQHSKTIVDILAEKESVLLEKVNTIDKEVNSKIDSIFEVIEDKDKQFKQALETQVDEVSKEMTLEMASVKKEIDNLKTQVMNVGEKFDDVNKRMFFVESSMKINHEKTELNLEFIKRQIDDSKNTTQASVIATSQQITEIRSILMHKK